MAYECDRCGACCVHLIIEIDELDIIREPKLMIAEPIRMPDGMILTDDAGRETPEIIPGYGAGAMLACGGPCKLLGPDNLCTIYPTRPNCCVIMQAGDEQCQMARNAAGLSPLRDKDSIMKMYVPSIGDKIRLTAPWEFPLFSEYRNESAVKFLHPTAGLDCSWRATGEQSITTTLPTGAILQVARIYIRQGKSAWDSITFKLLTHPEHKNKKGLLVACKCRFWAKLEDCNFIEFEKME